MASPKENYPARKDRKNPPYRSGRWLFGMLLVITLVVFTIAVVVQTSLS